MKKGWIVAAFALLSVAAVAGWVRKSAAPDGCAPLPYPAASAAYLQSYPAPYGAPTAYPPAPYGTPAYAARPAYYRSAPPVSGPVYSAPVHVRRSRPFSHSVAIVAGSAGTGAAIGALAGGGRGAGIGALAGGAAGFIYDRLTHNR